jgi:hypothetical protein
MKDVIIMEGIVNPKESIFALEKSLVLKDVE